MLVMPPREKARRECEEYEKRQNEVIEGLLNNFDEETVEGDNLTIDNCAIAPLKEFKICGKEMVQETREGYNQVDFANPDTIAPNTDFSFENDIVKISGTGSYKRVEWNILDLLKKNTGKILKCTCEDIDYSKASAGVIQIRTITDNKNTYHVLIKQGQNDKTYTIPDDISNITRAVLTIYSNDTANDIESSITVTKPMLYIDDGVKKEYEQYGQSPSTEFESPLEYVEGNQKLEHINKNLFDKEDQNMGYYSPDKIFHNSTVWYYREFKPIANTNYVLNGILSTLSSGACIVGFKNNEITIIQDGFSNINKFNSGSYDKIAYSVHKENIETAMFRLEVGDKNTSYVEHQSKKYQLSNLPPMYSDEDDYIYYNEFLKKYFVHNDYDKYVITGNENWILSSNTSDTLLVIALSDKLPFKALYNSREKSYMNMFKIYINKWENNLFNLYNVKDEFYNAFLITFDKSIYPDIASAKTKLKELYENETPAYLIYKTKREDTEITDTVLIEQLDEIRKIMTYKGTNHFIVTAENGQACNLEVTAYKDTFKILKEEIDNLKALVLEQEG